MTRTPAQPQGCTAGASLGHRPCVRPACLLHRPPPGQPHPRSGFITPGNSSIRTGTLVNIVAFHPLAFKSCYKDQQINCMFRRGSGFNLGVALFWAGSASPSHPSGGTQQEAGYGPIHLTPRSRHKAICLPIVLQMDVWTHFPGGFCDISCYKECCTCPWVCVHSRGACLGHRQQDPRPE